MENNNYTEIIDTKHWKYTEAAIPSTTLVNISKNTRNYRRSESLIIMTIRTEPIYKLKMTYAMSVTKCVLSMDKRWQMGFRGCCSIQSFTLVMHGYCNESCNENSSAAMSIVICIKKKQFKWVLNRNQGRVCINLPNMQIARVSSLCSNPTNLSGSMEIEDLSRKYLRNLTTCNAVKIAAKRDIRS